MQVVPAEPAPGLRASVHYRNGPTESWRGATGTLERGFVVPQPGPNTDSIVFVEKHRMARLHDFSKDQIVDLRSGIPFRLSIEFESEVPPGSNVRLEMRPVLDATEAVDKDLPWNRAVYEIAPKGKTSCLFALPHGGPYEIEVSIYPEGFGFPVAVALPETKVEVVDSDAEQDLHVSVTAADLEKALRR